jgi:aerobic-type carbon monoxide dehydrogenase small subunit (CoxS/CutS family)
MKDSYPPLAFTLNGKRASLRVHPLSRLLDVLREDCGLTGTKEGCGEGECGACTVIVNGQAVNSCLVPVAQVAGAKVVTIEGLKGRHRLQRAFAQFGGAQCGICTPGMILAAVALGPHPTLEQVRTGLAGNICRCTGYEGIYRAIRKAEDRSRKSHLRSQGSSLRLRSGQADPGSPALGERGPAARVEGPKAQSSLRGKAAPPEARRRRA